MLMISAVAMAEPDSQQVGPYTVSFDLDADYQAQIAEPMESEEGNAYSMALVLDNSTGASIVITENPDQIDATLDVYKRLMFFELILSRGLNTTNIKDIEIDGREGFLLTAEPIEASEGAPNEFYRAMYWLDSEDFGPVSAGTTSVTITSTYPLDVTEGLLSSLSVVKGEASSMATATDGQDFPPN